MKQIFRALGLLVAAALLLVIGLVAHNQLTYYSEHNALLREIQRHPNLTIVDHWRHEDMTLEDFGFGIQGARSAVFLNVSDGNSVRLPRDEAVGIALNVGRESHREGNTVYMIRRFIAFDSGDWQQRGLPKIRNMADFLVHFDVIADSLVANPPLTKTWEWLPGYIDVEVLRGRQRSTAPPKFESKLGF